MTAEVEVEGGGGGCVITADDSPRIMASFSLYFALLGRGICIGMLAAAIPVMADTVGVSPATFGQIFSARGMGYFVGTMCGSTVLQLKGLSVSRHAVACTAIIFSGIFTAMFAFTESLQIMLYLALGQGFGFGILRPFAFVAIMEMWGNRAQPWLQVKPCVLGLGGVIGPILVSTYGYKDAFIITGIFCTSCLGIYGLEYLASRTHKVVRWTTKKLHLRKSAAQAPVTPPRRQIGEDSPLLRTPGSQQFVTVDVQSSGNSIDSKGPNLSRHNSIYLSRDMGMVESVLSAAVNDLLQPGEVSSHHDFEADHDEDKGEQLTISDVLKSAPTLASALNNTSDPSGGGCYNGTNSSVEQQAVVELSQSDTQVVLPFATSSMVESIEIIEVAASHGSAASASLDVKLVPRKFLFFAGMFGFFYCGLFYSFSSWITSYGAGTGIATTADEASYLTSHFFLWVTVGSVFSVPMSVIFSTSHLLRFQLFFVVLGAGQIMIAGHSYGMLSIATGTLGFGTSCVFPLLICLANDYKFTM
jgi:hypothetical protein